LLFLCVLLSVSTSFALRAPRLARELGKPKDYGESTNYTVNWYVQTLDHFNFNTQPLTYKQRYLVNDQFWSAPINGQCGGPIFFYTGNEGDITLFYENTQFVTEVLAAEFQALIVFAEHRYYGLSLPFGNSSFELQNIGYFTTEQALADYAQLINDVIKGQMGAFNCPIIAVGGSYGGMLASWFRMKFPEVVDIAYAASAPIFQFVGTGVSDEAYSIVATNTFTRVSENCSNGVRTAFQQIQKLASQGSKGIQTLTQQFVPCTPLQPDASDLINWLVGGLQYMAMTDYPYPANFLEPMPGWPVSVGCKIMDSFGNNVLQGLFGLISVYYNGTGQAGNCFDMDSTTSSSLGDMAWDYQACTEMIFPISSNGVQDMFPSSPFNLTSLNEYCVQAWGVIPRALWIPTFFGTYVQEASYIIFTNGDLDPWSSGGQLKTVSDTVVAIYMDNSAHHLDLRLPNENDPPAVTAGRAQIVKLLSQWITDITNNKTKSH